MAKQKKEMSRVELLRCNYPQTGNYYIVYDDESLDDITNVNDAPYFKDQSDNPYFLSLKEDLINSIKSEFRKLKNDLKAMNSDNKKQLIKMEMDRYKIFKSKFYNTWEYFDFFEKVFNHGDIIDDDDIEFIKKQRQCYRAYVKENVILNHQTKDKFIKNYSDYLINHLVLQVIIHPLIVYTIWDLSINDNIYRLIYHFPQYLFQFFVMDGIFLYGGMLAAMPIILLIWFFNAKLLEKIMNGKTDKEPEKVLKKGFTTYIGAFLAFGLFRRIFHRPKDN